MRYTSLPVRHRLFPILASVSWIAMCTPGVAQTPLDTEALRAEIQSLKAEQAKTAERLARLEAALNTASAPTASSPSMNRADPIPAKAQASVSNTTAFNPQAPASRLTVQGDLRLRYEGNFSDNDAPNRQRAVLRARLRGAYTLTDWLSIGAQLATGDPDDPNSTDITLTGYNDDLEVSLDQVYMRAQFGNVTLYGGKFPQTFARTELVWDGDVSPAGVSAAWTATAGRFGFKATAMHFIVDEAAAGADSAMNGVQVSLDSGSLGAWRYELAAAYFDYTLPSVAGADSGDFRGNRLSGGRYVSDFRLQNLLGTLTYQGLGPRWPLRMTADLVKNTGAVDGDDTGYGLDMSAGRLSDPKDWRLTYGYAQAGVDAVFAAFSHDNTGLSTNYRQHTVAFDYALTRKIILNGTVYVYRPLEARFAGNQAPDDWLQRLRLNLLVNF